nr:retrovirus-related Pol polyprotein from transposon TNT 1-94 [Tanacetum cinerariifolium]
MLYDERVINLGYTPMFLKHFNEALEIEKFKRARENKIEFAYDYENLNASYVNEKINLSDDYFQEIINPDFDKIDSSFQQTSSLKPYVPTVILEKIIIDLEDEVVSLLEKKANLETIETWKSKDLDTLSSVRRPKPNGVMWMRKWSSNTVKADLSFVNHSNLNKNVKRYSRKNLMACNNFDTRSAFDCNNARNVLCNARMNASVDVNDLFVFDDIVQIYLWIIDSGCSKHMTGNRTLLTNFVEKFLGTVRFGNNDFAVIAGYRDVVIGLMTIKKVYYVEGLGHNLFSVGQFCDKGLEVAFRKSTCFVRTEDGIDFLTGDRSSNLYTIALNKVASNSSACLLAKAFSSQSWLWHQHLSHLNFATINKLVKNNLVQGLPKTKFEKDHLCSASEQDKIHQKHHNSKTAFASNQPLYLLHMDLCGPMRVESINGKRYVLVVVDDYTRYTWRVRTDNGTEFKNKTLAKFFDEVGITQHFSAARTPQQNYVVEKRNRTLVEAARTMLTFANLPLFIWAEAITTACFIQNQESSSSSLNDDVHQSLKEVAVPSSNTQSISNDMIPNVDEASTSHNVFNERLNDAYFDATLKDADWVSAMQEELDQFARLKV